MSNNLELYENSELLEDIFLAINDIAQEVKKNMGGFHTEPMYTEFKIHGNLVILMEPLATEDQNDTIKFLNNAASNIK